MAKIYFREQWRGKSHFSITMWSLLVYEMKQEVLISVLFWCLETIISGDKEVSHVHVDHLHWRNVLANDQCAKKSHFSYMWFFSLSYFSWRNLIWFAISKKDRQKRKNWGKLETCIWYYQKTKWKKKKNCLEFFSLLISKCASYS